MLTLNPQNPDAIKNFLVPDGTKCKIYDIHVKHRDAYTKEYINYISGFDVMGYTMLYKFQPKDYVFIHVNYGDLRKTVFVAEVSAFSGYLLQNLFNSDLIIKYYDTSGIPCW